MNKLIIQLILLSRAFLKNSMRKYNAETRLFTVRSDESEIPLLETVYTN